MMIRWDLWQFRNKIKHDPNGPEDRAVHNDLNFQINLELTRGPNGIQEDCHHLFQPPYTQEYLLEQSIYIKNLWLTDVFNARDAINNKEQDPEAIQDRNQQEAMRDYLGANIDLINVAPLPGPSNSTGTGLNRD